MNPSFNTHSVADRDTAHTVLLTGIPQPWIAAVSAHNFCFTLCATRMHGKNGEGTPATPTGQMGNANANH